jgi:hypothetical protein
MKKTLAERILGAELMHHLGYGPGEGKPVEQPNHRNGSTPKTVLTGDDAVTLDIPRDCAGMFAPQLVPKHVRQLPGGPEQGGVRGVRHRARGPQDMLGLWVGKPKEPASGCT